MTKTQSVTLDYYNKRVRVSNMGYTQAKEVNTTKRTATHGV